MTFRCVKVYSGFEFTDGFQRLLSISHRQRFQQEWIRWMDGWKNGWMGSGKAHHAATLIFLQMLGAGGTAVISDGVLFSVLHACWTESPLDQQRLSVTPSFAVVFTDSSFNWICWHYANVGWKEVYKLLKGSSPKETILKQIERAQRAIIVFLIKVCSSR